MNSWRTSRLFGAEFMFPREPNHWLICVLGPLLFAQDSIVHVSIRPLEDPAQYMVQVFFDREHGRNMFFGTVGFQPNPVAIAAMQEARDHGLIEGSFRFLNPYDGSLFNA